MNKTKRLISTIILSLVCILSFAIFFSSVNFSKVNAEEETLSIVVSDERGKIGGSVDVELSLKNNPGVASIGIDVSYGENLTLTNVTFNSEMGGQTGASNYAKNGSPAKLIWVSGEENYTSDSIFATLTFSVSEEATEGELEEITITYDEDDVYDINENNVALNVETGFVYFSNSIAGDVNKDGAVNNKDITRLIQYLTRWEVEVDKWAVDVNGDGKENNKDLTRLVQFLADWDVNVYLTNAIRVEFDGNGGTLVEGKAIQMVFPGEDAVAPTFEREDYEFIGYDVEYTNITEKTVVIAQWKHIAHTFTEKNTDSKYLKSSATCTQKAVYYYSCPVCGEIGTETFEYGELKAHNYVDGQCSVCGRYEEPKFIVDTVIAEKGDTDVAVNINIKKNPGIISAKLTVNYDKTKLQVTSYTVNSDLGGNTSKYSSKAKNLSPLWVDGEAEKNMTDDCLFVTLYFTVLDTADAVNPITVTYDDDNVYNIDEENVYFDIINGAIKIEEEEQALYTRIDSEGNESATGNYILFGSYPQTDVTSSMGTTLSSYVSTLPSNGNNNGWTSYKYYIEGSNTTDYMWYKDVDVDSNGTNDYRAVYFTSYRPYYTTYSSSTSYSYQDDNGYTVSNVYWFKYESIKWRILTESDGKATLLAELILDSQQYDYDGSYSNNYANSTIRAWLNDSFYNTAFSTLQQAIINTVEVDNSARSTNPDNNATQWNNGVNNYACENTQDKIWLLSEQEVTKSEYGFNTTPNAEDNVRQKKTSGYSQCMGAYTYTSSNYLGNGLWWLRSPHCDDANYSWFVNFDGYSSYFNYIYVYFTGYGVVPALQISL